MRRTITVIWLVAALLLCLATALHAADDEVDVEQLVREIDAYYRADNSYSDIEMEIVTPHWQRTLSMKSWTEGMDKTFIRIDAPKKDKGVATLRLDNEMWNYLPKTDKVMKVPPSMMMGSWMGSDFTNDDLVNEFSLFEDYSYDLFRPEGAENDLLYLRCVPRPDLPVVWGSIVVGVRRADHLMLFQKYYDEKGKLMRVLSYSEVRQFGDRRLPAVLELVPQNKSGHKTVIRYLSATFNSNLPDDVFSLRHLRTHK
ncbi:MAG: outer membrane lipoprotein-sorting protein [Candidatus Zixiibacteriota bacterium]